ncbi:Glycoside hydrolase subgroup catalytic core [Macrophomina phaseolina MS6]|uniref:Glycoside hydrolase subgroup catalytic core n=1 Tax=Macrophomina phaseolina (strain MS6) TaxID=1126212 RepID=K2R1D9_MACPH|nr:Glycoside hydrolase subgroup catalytic core [Macrophomina phaseolina MS6]
MAGPLGPLDHAGRHQDDGFLRPQYHSYTSGLLDEGGHTQPVRALSQGYGEPRYTTAPHYLPPGTGGFTHLQKFCGWASDAGMYIIIDLHGMPGRQKGNDAFTGDVSAASPHFSPAPSTPKAHHLSISTNPPRASTKATTSPDGPTTS